MHQVAGKFLLNSHSKGILKRFGRVLRRVDKPFDSAGFESEVRKDLDRNEQDALIAFHCSGVAETLEKSKTPIIYVTDATADLLQGYYPTRSDLNEAELRKTHEGERRVIARADRTCVPTEWVAASVIGRYHASPERVSVVEWGANLDDRPPVESRQPIDPKSGTLELLFIGLDWRRKGGDIAVRMLDELVAKGLDARLTVVGADLPTELQRKNITSLGRMSRANPAESSKLDTLLKRAHFLIHPARAECFGHVLCEAMAFGTPVVATDTGGISQCVKHGETGVLLPPGSAPEEYATEVLRLAYDGDAYTRLSENAVNDFQKRLNWDRWASRVLDLVAELRTTA